MKNVTANEKTRSRWNANLPKDFFIEVGGLAKFKHFYWSKLSVSRIEKYFELRKQALAMNLEANKQEEKQVHQSMVSF